MQAVGKLLWLGALFLFSLIVLREGLPDKETEGNWVGELGFSNTTVIVSGAVERKIVWFE